MNNETRIIQLISHDGFMSAFWEIAKTARTQVEAYELLEAEYESYFKKPRYSSFDSFRISRDYRNKK